MKDPVKLQKKLVALLRDNKLRLQFPTDRSWSDLEWKEVAWVVKDFVNSNPDVINSNPLYDWLDECTFMLSESHD